MKIIDNRHNFTQFSDVPAGAVFVAESSDLFYMKLGEETRRPIWMGANKTDQANAVELGIFYGPRSFHPAASVHIVDAELIIKDN